MAVKKSGPIATATYVNPDFAAAIGAITAQMAANAPDPYASVPKGPYFSPINPEINWGGTNPSSPAPSGSSPSPSSPSTPASPPPPPAPVYPTFRPITGQTKNVLVAPSDIIQFDNENVDVALMQDLLFEDIGAIELANISRSDLIDGQEVSYSPIKNLSTIRREFNPNNIILTANSNDYFSRFGIDLSAKTIYEPYFDEDGNLVIEIDGVAAGEEIDVQILSNGTIDLVDDV